MGSEEAKIEKKKQKAQLKIEKARVKANVSQPLSPEQNGHQSTPSKNEAPQAWYKDPNWVRAIIAIITLIVMVVTLYFTL